jgi:hypothetical protein
MYKRNITRIMGAPEVKWGSAYLGNSKAGESIPEVQWESARDPLPLLRRRFGKSDLDPLERNALA